MNIARLNLTATYLVMYFGFLCLSSTRPGNCVIYSSILLTSKWTCGLYCIVVFNYVRLLRCALRFVIVISRFLQCPKKPSSFTGAQSKQDQQADKVKNSSRSSLIHGSGRQTVRGLWWMVFKNGVVIQGKGRRGGITVGFVEKELCWSQVRYPCRYSKMCSSGA